MAQIPFPDNVPTAPLTTLHLHKLIANDSAEVQRLYDASRSLGFFYLDMRGSPEGERLLTSADRLFELERDMFALPLQEKNKYNFAKEGKYYGYKAMGAEVIDGKGTLDRNEIYNIAKDDVLSISQQALPQPGVIASNHNLLETYVHQNDAVLQVLFNSLSRALNLPSSSTLYDLHRLDQASGCHTRFIRAPPPPKDATTNPALGEHTDFGSLTILFNRVGGLQVLLPNTSDWVYVKPVPGCAIINLGDAMVKFTAGRLRSNLHRVVTPPGAQKDEVRYSLVYFCRPGHDVKLGRLQGGDIDLQPKNDEKDVPEKASEWLKRRHLGRKIEYFQGEESWENAKGTEARL
ncbi:hypothetical protein LTS15_004069 [Exophiala xenobiotica]|nr:hypothetical protein LTS15_004069 [Exophiala xenobiotica]